MKATHKVLHGSIFDKIKEVPDNYIQSVITSPPYFGHRNYSGDEKIGKYEIGREKKLEDYISNIISVFNEIKPKLRDDGLLWLNLGDTYRNKRQLGVPWRVAIALQDEGWILRSDIIWHKPNAMPSSVRDRPTTDHEYVFMFAKTDKYYYNADAIREEHVTFTNKSQMKGGRNHLGKRNGTPEVGKNKGNNNLHDGRWDQAFHPLGRNKRTVWNIPLSKFRDGHFAVFPEKLVETCLLASTKENDIVFDPFTGSGTTGVVAKKNGRNFVGIELVERYKIMAQDRIDEVDVHQLSLFKK